MNEIRGLMACLEVYYIFQNGTVKPVKPNLKSGGTLRPRVTQAYGI